MNAKLVKTSGPQMVAAIKAAYKASPEGATVDASGSGPISLSAVLKGADACQRLEPSGFERPGDTPKHRADLRDQTRLAFCHGLIWGLFDVYRATDSHAFYEAAVAVYNYARSSAVSDYTRSQFLNCLTGACGGRALP